VGVAVAGVVFFGLLSSRAATAVATVTPQVQAQLAAANLPPAQVDGAVSTFTRCFKAHASSSDPTQPVAGCPTGTPSSSATAVPTILANASQTALGRDFVTSVERILFFNVGFWALTGILSMFLPRVRSPGAPGVAHSA